MHAKLYALANSDQAKRWFLGGLCILFAAVSIQYTFKIIDEERNNRSAFLRWREQILDLDDGVNIYGKYEYPNPPIMALLLEPLAELPPIVGSLTWFYLKVGMLFLIFGMIYRMLNADSRPFPFWGMALAIVLSIRPLVGDLTHGNINIFILFLVVLSLYTFQIRREWTAGIALALSIACKVTPALFIPYFAWKRSWKTLGGCFGGLLLFLFVIPGVQLGLRQNTFLLSEWFDQMIVPYMIEGVVTTEHQNQSLPGLAHRMLTHEPSFTRWNGTRYVPTDYHNIANFDPVVVRWLMKVCMVAFAAVVVWSCRTPITLRPNWQLAAECSIVVLGMLLFSERTWKHHYVTLIVPFSVIVYFLVVVRPSPTLRNYVIGSLVMSIILIMTTSTGVSDSMTWFGKQAQAYGAYVWANLVLVAALVVMLRSYPVNAEQNAPSAGDLARTPVV